MEYKFMDDVVDEKPMEVETIDETNFTAAFPDDASQLFTAVSPDEASQLTSEVVDEINFTSASSDDAPQLTFHLNDPIVKFRTELDACDVKLVNELGQLSVDQLLDYMKNLQNNAFLLGEEETKEFQRTKNLGIFQK